MSIVVSFDDFTPTARYDSVAWESIKIEEASDPTAGPWTVIDTLTISPVDADPSKPASRSFTTPNGTAIDLWYRITFLDGVGGQTEPTTPQQNAISAAPLATVDEFFRILSKNNPSDEQVDAAEGDLATATLEIITEIDWADDHAPATAEQLDLMKGVCLDRAADLWRHRESAPGILGIVDEGVQPGTGRYSWARYSARLSVIKDQWPVA